MTERLLVTGADGAVGTAVLERLATSDRWIVLPTDIDTLDVTDRDAVSGLFGWSRPDVVLHLAGQKHAPEGEVDIARTVAVNVDGTRTVLDAATEIGARVVTASTCKACDPETVYGSTKLVAERLTLNAGGVVIRFHNIPEAGGNVLRLWESLPANEPLPVCDAWRYFLPMEQAVDLATKALTLPSGRYMVNPGTPRWIPALAADLYPDRAQQQIPLRRGDRYREPLHAACETTEPAVDLVRVRSPYDPVPAALPLAA